MQEDIVDKVYQVLLYRHPAARCTACRRWVRQTGCGEILGNRIGPGMRSWAGYLRNDIGASYRKVPKVLEELLGFAFTPAALIGFEKMLEGPARPLVDDIAKKIGASDPDGQAEDDQQDGQTSRSSADANLLPDVQASAE